MSEVATEASRRPPLAVHVDLDGADVIFRAHGRRFRGAGDPIYRSGMRNLLSLFKAQGVRATLFVIAEDLADAEKLELLGEACAAGHELASHTMTHRNLRALSVAEKRHEIDASRKTIEDVLGVPVRGFRAPGYSIDREGLRILADSGYTYDTSAMPTSAVAARLGVPLPRLLRPLRLEEFDGLVELPLPDHRPLPIPVGPSYALLAGFPLFAWGMKRAAARARRAGRAADANFHAVESPRS